MQKPFISYISIIACGIGVLSTCSVDVLSSYGVIVLLSYGINVLSSYGANMLGFLIFSFLFSLTLRHFSPPVPRRYYATMLSYRSRLQWLLLFVSAMQDLPAGFINLQLKSFFM